MAWSPLLCVLSQAKLCVCVYTVSLGQDCISPLFNEVLRPPMLSALDTSCHYRALVTGGAAWLPNGAKRPHTRCMSGVLSWYDGLT